MKLRTRGWKSMIKRKRNLRTNLTAAEKRLWYKLKDLSQERFRRQHGIGPYIADFYHAKTMTVVEIDGKIHDDPEVQKNDRIREQYLMERGYKIIRFKNEEVLTVTDRVIHQIEEFIQHP